MVDDDRTFQAAVAKVLDHEGGYVNDPADPGGETNYGISRRAHPSVDIRNLTREAAVEIYRREYWDEYGYGMIGNAALAAKLFDLAVNMGPLTANKLLQSSVNATSPAALAVDGHLGLLSFTAINNHPNPDYLFATLKLMAVAHYLAIGKTRFLAGWIRRALD